MINGVGNTTNAGGVATMGAGALDFTYTSTSTSNSLIYALAEEGNAPFVADVGVDGQIAVDYTTPQVGPGGVFNLNIVFSTITNSGGLFQPFSAVATVNHGSYFTNYYNYNVPPGPYFPLLFALEFGNSAAIDGSSFSVDDVRIVPEPGTMLMAAGVSLFLRRRVSLRGGGGPSLAAIRSNLMPANWTPVQLAGN